MLKPSSAFPDDVYEIVVFADFFSRGDADFGKAEVTLKVVGGNPEDPGVYEVKGYSEDFVYGDPILPPLPDGLQKVLTEFQRELAGGGRMMVTALVDHYDNTWVFAVDSGLVRP